MGNLMLNDMQKFFEVAKVSLWRLEIDNDECFLYGNDCFDELAGCDSNLLPSEKFEFFNEHVSQLDKELFKLYLQSLLSDTSEIIYRYDHPTMGQIYIRCCGTRDFDRKDKIVIGGYHQNVTDLITLEDNNKISDDNVKLKKHQIELENFYKHLLDSESCGLMAYTYPEHKMIHLNKKAREIYNISEDEIDCTNKLFEIAKDTYMPDPETIIKLYRLKNYDGSVDYTEVLNYGKENEKEVIARTTSFLSDNKRVLITTLIDTSEYNSIQTNNAIFEAIASDYMSIFKVDLLNNLVSLVYKKDNFLNKVREKTLQVNAYYEIIKIFNDNYIDKELCPDFLEIMSPEYLVMYLSKHNTFTYAFKCKTNEDKIRDYEIKFIRLTNEQGYIAIMCSRLLNETV